MAPNLPKTYRAQVFEEKSKPLVLRNVPLKMPERGEVLIKVHACGVCHSDLLVTDGVMGTLYVY